MNNRNWCSNQWRYVSILIFLLISILMYTGNTQSQFWDSNYWCFTLARNSGILQYHWTQIERYISAQYTYQLLVPFLLHCIFHILYNYCWLHILYKIPADSSVSSLHTSWHQLIKNFPPGHAILTGCIHHPIQHKNILQPYPPSYTYRTTSSQQLVTRAPTIYLGVLFWTLEKIIVLIFGNRWGVLETSLPPLSKRYIIIMYISSVTSCSIRCSALYLDSSYCLFM